MGREGGLEGWGGEGGRVRRGGVGREGGLEGMGWGGREG